MDTQTLIYLLFFLGAIARPIVQYGLARAQKPGIKFNWRYLVGQAVGAATGFLSLLLVGNLPDVQGVVESLNLSGTLFFVAAFAYGYFWSSIGRQGDKGVQIVKSGSSNIT